MRKILFIILIFTIFSGIASAIDINATDTLQYSNDTGGTTDYGSYTKIAEINLTIAYTGSFRVSWDVAQDCIACDEPKPNIYTKIYKNGVAWGIEHSTGGTDRNYKTYAEDFTGLSTSPSDKIQLYAYTIDGDNDYYNYFHISFNQSLNNNTITNPNGLYTSNPQVNITWTNSPGATNYFWQTSTSSTFASIYSQGNTSSSNLYAGTQQIDRNILGTWYFRVRPNNTLGTGNFSATTQMNYVTISPVPNFTSPLNNTTTSAPFTLVWSATTGVNDTTTKIYQWQISSVSDFSTIYNQSNTTSLNSGLIRLYSAGEWFMRMRVNNTFQNSSWSNVSKLYTVIPNMSVILTPYNFSYQNNFTLNLSWTTLQERNGTSPSVNYNWQISNNSSFPSGNITLQGNTTNQNYTGLISSLLNNVTYYIRVMSNNTMLNSSWSNNTSFLHVRDVIFAANPSNTSTGTSVSIILGWTEAFQGMPYTYYLSTDDQFINIIQTGSEVSTNGALRNSSSISLTTNTQYYWKVKNSTGVYSAVFEFTTGGGSVTPGGFNITVWDEQNTSLQILNYSIQLQNSTHILTKASNTTNGWTNFSTEIASGEYLIIVTPNGTFSNYYQRMVLNTSPANVTMYLPNSTNNTIDLVAFSLLDITGLFPYQTSTISVYKGGLLQDKSYFSADGTHPVYLIQGTNYQIQVQHGSSIFSYGNYVAIASGTSQIVTSNFNTNSNDINPFSFNISYDQTTITLNWNDTSNTALSSLNYTVYEGTPAVELCQLTTTVKHGQTVCGINTSSTYHVIFSALMTDGTYRNYTASIDYTTGNRKSSTGISADDGSLTGIGFIWNYGTFVMPDWVYNWISVILIIILAGSFGGFHSGVGSMITIFFALILEYTGLFRPIDDDATQALVMGLTLALLVMSVVYYLQHKDRNL